MDPRGFGLRPGGPWRLALSCASLIAALGCESGSDTPSASPRAPRFEDATDRAGVDFVTICGGKEKDWVLEVNGAGVALFDYDLDGRLDVFFVNGSKLPPPHGEGPSTPPPSDKLYRNLGDLRFEDVTSKAGLTESSWGCGVTIGDYDNDGDQDIFVANYGSDRLWRNDGDGTFTDVTATSGADDPRWGSSCAFLDYDRDGWLDLFIVNYLVFDPAAVKRRGVDPSCQYKGQPILCGPVGLPPVPCSLFRNRGDGTFEDVSDTCGIRKVNLKDATYGLGVTVLDFDGDDWLDIYVANDTTPNLLFRNLGNGRFQEIGMQSGVALNDEAIAQAGMGVDAVFLGGKEREDLFVANYEDDNNTYYSNVGDGFFTEITPTLGLAEPCFKYLGWGSFFFDPDLDGDLDLFIAQGHVVPQADDAPSSPGYKQPNKLFLNDGGGRFDDWSDRAGAGLRVEKSSRGAAFGDLDGDGDADIVVNEIDDRATILENAGEPRSRWLAVRAIGGRRAGDPSSAKKSNRDALGAVVTVKAAGRTQRRRLRSGSSYASHSEVVARFGLGDATRVDELRVRWPTGKEEVFEVPGVDRAMTVVEGEGRSTR